MSEGDSGDPGMARPRPVLGEGERAFERGDWREARRIARARLAAGNDDERVAAREMLSRFRPDPLLIALYAGGAITLLLIALHYLR